MLDAGGGPERPERVRAVVGWRWSREHVTSGWVVMQRPTRVVAMLANCFPRNTVVRSIRVAGDEQLAVDGVPLWTFDVPESWRQVCGVDRELPFDGEAIDVDAFRATRPHALELLFPEMRVGQAIAIEVVGPFEWIGFELVQRA